VFKVTGRDYCYRIFGLVLHSTVPLPELGTPRIAALGADVKFRVSAGPAPVQPDWFAASAPSDGIRWLICSRSEDGYVLNFPACAAFVVDQAGSEIVCCGAVAGVAEETIRHLLIDHVLPMVLNLRGRDALHATAVLTADGVCAFAGASGSGKSTLAASFLAAGCPVLADDCLVIQTAAAGVAAVPAYPGLRLEADSFAALRIPAQPSLAVAHYSSKRRVVLAQDSFPDTPCPLARIYLLERAAVPVPTITPIRGRAAVTALLAHLYRLDIGDRAMLRRQFALLEELSRAVPIGRLTIPARFDALNEVRALIMAELTQPRRGDPSLTRVSK
jgi:hypothetical protein